MAVKDENLEDVIASLVDDVEDNDDTVSMPGFPEVSGEISENPVTLTKRAANQIRSIRENEDLDENLYLRVAVEGGGCSGLNYKLGFDIRTDDDEIVKSQDLEIVIDEKHIIYLDGIEIDYPDGLDARGFTFDNPNASESCGCGASFAV